MTLPSTNLLPTLVVHYLDNLLLGPQQPRKNIFLRCKFFPTEVINKLILADTKPGGGYGAKQFNARGKFRQPTASMLAAEKIPATSATTPPVMANVLANSAATVSISAATLPRFLREKYPALSNSTLATAFKKYNANMTREMHERHAAEKNSTLQNNLWLADQVFASIDPANVQHEPSMSTLPSEGA